MIVIIDYGMGNLKSVYNALKNIECEAKISSNAEELRRADALILPGVGAFQDCMDNLERTGLCNVIKEEVEKGKALLGICLGMQVLFEKGFEGGETKGLGLLRGEVRKMVEPNEKIPHIGWNNIEKNKEDFLMNGIEENSYVYYVHSFYVQDYRDEDLLGYSTYGKLKIPGLVRRDNVMGAQFHPEKSGEEGLKILRNFKEMVL